MTTVITNANNIMQENTFQEGVIIDLESEPELKKVTVVPNPVEDKIKPKIRFVLMNDPQPPKVLKKDIFYINNDWRCVHMNMVDPKDWDSIDKWVGRLRRIIDGCGIFRCEDIDMIRWNSDLFSNKGGWISGSTYVRDGRLQLFQNSILEIEKKVASYR